MAKKTTEERFRAKTRRSDDGCLEWTGSLKSGRYGYITVEGTGTYAHRLSWTMRNGEIPEGSVIDHICGNTRCVDPEHLRAVTQKQNAEHRTRVSSKSGYRGVSFDKRAGRWEVRVCNAGQRIYGGHFDSPEDANEAAIELRNTVFTHNDLDRVA